MQARDQLLARAKARLDSLGWQDYEDAVEYREASELSSLLFELVEYIESLERERGSHECQCWGSDD